jgi:putative tricarboxylic transport membrane protein
MLQNIIDGVSMALNWNCLFTAFLGVLFGIVMGAIPGLNEIIAICLLIPFTFYLNPVAGISMLVGVAKGTNFGGSIPAILFNIPGTAQALITCFDGYPLTQKGQGGKALKMALYASTIADSVSDLILFFFAAPVAAVALMVGPPEYAAIVFFALSIIAITGSENLAKGMLAVGLGLLIAVIGLDPITATERLTFGSVELSSGIDIVPVCLGLFVISEIYIQISRKHRQDRREESRPVVRTGEETPENHRVNGREFRRCLPAIFTGIGIGSAVGAIPGIGTTIASYLSYTRVQRSSKNPERFGRGALEGVAAAEAGNNAVNGPNLIPLITLGIPGNLVAALILGAFMMQGLTPGPMFMQQQAPLLYALFTVLFISNLFTFLIGSVLVKYVRRLVEMPKTIVFPAVLAVAIVGCYVVRNDTFDLFIMFVCGVLGLFLRRSEIPIAPLLVAFILGTSFEKKFRQTMVLSGGDFFVYLTHPIALGFILLTVLTAVLLTWQRRKQHQRNRPVSTIED